MAGGPDRVKDVARGKVKPIPDKLLDLAVPVGDLKRHPRNPRRGNLEAIRASLERFGQTRPIVATENGTIVAGHHVWEAFKDLGWPEIAVVKLPLTAKEAAAYLLADNRTSDLAAYDDAELAAILGRTAKQSTLEGTGYADKDLQKLLRRLDAGPATPAEPSGSKLLHTCPECGHKW